MKLELEPESFDAIILLGTASNMHDFPSALSKIRSLLKHNGFVLFNFPHADSLLIAQVYGLRYWMFVPSLSNFMTLTGCLKMLAQAQFTPANISTDTQQPQQIPAPQQVGSLHPSPLQKLDKPASYRSQCRFPQSP